MSKFHQVLRTVGLTAAAGLLALSSQANAATIATESFNGGPGIFTAAGSVVYGTYGARMRGTTSVDGSLAATINTQGVTGMTLGFTSSTTGLDTGEYGEVRVLNQAGTVLYSRQVRSGSLLASGSKISISGTHTSLRVEFRVNASSSLEYLTVDNVLLEGTRTTASGSCDNLLPGSYNCTLNGRSYEVYVPNGVARNAIIDMHDYQQTATTQKNSSGWRQIADTQGLIVAWPQGVSNSWNAQGTCCGTSTADDVAFLRSLIDKIRASNASSVLTSVFMTGLGNGASMAHTMACQAADKIAGAIPVGYGLSGGSGYNAIVQNCNPSNDIEVISFHGTNDAFANYTSGVYDSLGAQDSFNAWADINACSGGVGSSSKSISSSTSCQINACSNGLGVYTQQALCTVTGGDHNLYNGDVGGQGLAAEAWQIIKDNNSSGGWPGL